MAAKDHSCSLIRGLWGENPSRSWSHRMSIFGNIVSAIFKHGTAAATTSAAGSSASAAKGTASGASGITGKPLTQDQVEDVIKKIADAQDEEYDWKESIVDLMKLLKLDSSLRARKKLAQELGYRGELTGSEEINIWLHKRVMQKIADSGGVVPEALKQA
jgi:Domain of unknown function (DUF3597)